MIDRGLGTPWGGISGGGRTTIDFEFDGNDEEYCRREIAAAFAKTAPGIEYTTHLGKYPPYGEDFEK